MDHKLIIDALRGNASVAADAKFSAQDTNTAAIKELFTEAGLSDKPSGRELVEKKPVFFAIISEVIDEILPEDLKNIMGMFAEVKNYARDEQVVFKLATGKRRARLAIKRGARGGIYRAAKWDNKFLELSTETWTVGDYVTLEDLILGRVSLSEYYLNILAGFEDKVFAETVAALRQAKSLAPASHIKADDGTGLEAKLDELVRIARAYGGSVTIFGFGSELSKLTNITDWKVEADRSDKRMYGFIKELHGTPVVELPNYILKDGATIDWAFKENDIFVLPGDAKPVKIALRGDTVIADDTEPGGGEKWNASKIMGLGLLLVDNVCILTDSSGDESGEY